MPTLTKPRGRDHGGDDDLARGLRAIEEKYQTFLGVLERCGAVLDGAGDAARALVAFDRAVDAFQFNARDEESLLDAYDVPDRDAYAAERRRIGMLLHSLRADLAAGRLTGEHAKFLRLIRANVAEHRDRFMHAAAAAVSP